MRVEQRIPKMPPKGKSCAGKGRGGVSSLWSDSADKKAKGSKGGGSAVKVWHNLCDKPAKVWKTWSS